MPFQTILKNLYLQTRVNASTSVKCEVLRQGEKITRLPLQAEGSALPHLLVHHITHQVSQFKTILHGIMSNQQTNLERASLCTWATHGTEEACMQVEAWLHQSMSCHIRLLRGNRVMRIPKVISQEQVNRTQSIMISTKNRRKAIDSGNVREAL